MNFSFYIAKRYLRSSSKSKAINIISAISSIGIVVGTAALFIVLSGFSGLVDFSLSFSNQTDADLTIVPSNGKTFAISEPNLLKIKKITNVYNCSKTVEDRVLFVFDGKDEVAYLKGVDSNFTKVNDFDKTVFEGKWLGSDTGQVVVGVGIAQKLSLGLMDFNNPLEVFVPKPGAGTIENVEEAFNKSVLIPVGFFSIVDEVDAKYVFSDLSLAQDILSLKSDEVSKLEIKLKSTEAENSVRSEISTIFGNKVLIKNRLQMNDALYKMLNTENVAVYLIFTLVIILVLFAFVGSVIMMILDKKSNLKTLNNLGVTVRELRNIFLIQGSLLCLIGSLIGLVLGSVFVLIQINFSVLMINETMAYPMKFTTVNVLVVLFTITILGFIASIIASRSINKKLLV